MNKLIKTGSLVQYDPKKLIVERPLDFYLVLQVYTDLGRQFIVKLLHQATGIIFDESGYFLIPVTIEAKNDE